MKKNILFVAFFALICYIPHSHAQLISTIAGNTVSAETGDGGPATAASLLSSFALTKDSHGNLYISSGSGIIRKINSAGIISTYAGTGSLGYSGDGGPATAASIDGIEQLATDSYDNLYVVDGINNVVRKIDASGIITTFAGHAGSGSTHGEGVPATSVSLAGPAGVAVDKYDNVYISDLGAYIKKIDVSGIIRTIAGNGTLGYSGDEGPATDAEMNNPGNIAVDNMGNIFTAERENHVVRKIDAAGIITTYAGNGYHSGLLTGGYSGDDGLATAARLNGPLGIAVDTNSGVVYFSDSYNNRVRKVDPLTHIITTYAGTGTGGYSGDGGPAVFAQMSYSAGLIVDAAGALYLCDFPNNVVRLVTPTTENPPVFVTPFITGVVICDNDTLGLDSLLAIIDSDSGQPEVWSVCTSPMHGTLNGFNDTAISTGAAITPSGLSYMPAIGYSGTDTFTVYVSDDTVVSIAQICLTVAGCSLNAGNLSSPADRGLHVYPNPSSSLFTLEIPGGNVPARMVITDVLGRTVLTATVKDKAEINIPGNLPGTYFIKVDSGTKTYREKMVVY